MNFSLQKLIGTLIVLIVTGFLVATPVMAQDEERYYLRISGVNQNISGDFDGNRLYRYVQENSIYTLAPDLERETGVGLIFGGQSGRLFGEISLFYGEHDSSFYYYNWADAFELDKTRATNLSLVFKYAFIDPEQSKVVPYALIGATYDIIKVKNGAAKIVSNIVTAHDDIVYKGYGGKLGVGFMLKLNAKLALDFSYAAGRTKLDHAKAFDHKGKPEDLKINSQIIDLGLNFYF
jgi:hypothetical protein